MVQGGGYYSVLVWSVGIVSVRGVGESAASNKKNKTITLEIWSHLEDEINSAVMLFGCIFPYIQWRDFFSIKSPDANILIILRRNGYFKRKTPMNDRTV